MESTPQVPVSIPPQPAPPPITSGSKALMFIREKECKGSVRYKNINTQDPEIDTIYVSRKSWPTMPMKIQMTLSPVVG